MSFNSHVTNFSRTPLTLWSALSLSHWDMTESAIEMCILKTSAYEEKFEHFEYFFNQYKISGIWKSTNMCIMIRYAFEYFVLEKKLRY